MIRLFTAVDLPESVKDNLGELCAGVPGAKWGNRSQMHLTLCFIGEVDDARFEAIKAGLNSIQVAPFHISLSGVGQFPPKGAARILWVGLDSAAEITTLYSPVRSTLTGLGLELDTRPYAPHITLARFRSPQRSEGLRRFHTQHAQFKTPPIPINAFMLYSSSLADGAAVYKHEAVYPLKDE